MNSADEVVAGRAVHNPAAAVGVVAVVVVDDVGFDDKKRKAKFAWAVTRQNS